MKKFILNILFFALILGVVGEITLRHFHLVSELPERYIDKFGIQRYTPGQRGYIRNAKAKWVVNHYGWVGNYDIKKDSTISIIGDSFIENLMNPMECHQGSLLGDYFPDYSFFEAARSGVTFIESMEISKILAHELNPRYQIIYLNEEDFYESIADINTMSDRLQISIKDRKLLKSKIHLKGIRKALYSVKLLYYLYKYPFFLKNQQDLGSQLTSQKQDNFDKDTFNFLFKYCSEKYQLDNLIFVFHPNVDARFIALCKSYKIPTILLNASNDKPWNIDDYDLHWSCYGNTQASKQVANALNEILN